jgi:hypothetical protein
MWFSVVQDPTENPGYVPPVVDLPRFRRSGARSGQADSDEDMLSDDGDFYDDMGNDDLSRGSGSRVRNLSGDVFPACSAPELVI